MQTIDLKFQRQDLDALTDKVNEIVNYINSTVSEPTTPEVTETTE